MEIKQEYLDRTYAVLMQSLAQQRRFREANYGLNTPIDAKRLEDVPRGKIILSQEVFEQLLKVNDESEKAAAEFAYYLTGTTEGQTVRFDNIIWARNQGNNTVANFTPLQRNIEAYISSVLKLGLGNAIICNGHTHPKQLSRYSEDFSLADMAGFMQIKEDNPVFRNKHIELCSGIMSDLSLNFCFYDEDMQDFYIFNDVVLELETGEQIPLSCYDRKVERSEIAFQIDRSGFRAGLNRGAPTLLEQSRATEPFTNVDDQPSPTIQISQNYRT